MSIFDPAYVPLIGLDATSVEPLDDDLTPWPSDVPLLIIGGDHAYTQWYGTDGSDGMAAMYLDRGIRPYMAINTCDPGGDYPGASGRMSYAQIGELERRGVEIVNHGGRHFQSWMRCSTGITVRYNGSGTDVYLSISTGAPRTLTTTCTGAAGDNQSFDLTNASYNTLQKVVDAFNAVAGGKYQAALAPELTGAEDSANLCMITGMGIKGSVADTGYSQTAWATGTVYAVGDVRRAVSNNGYYFVCTTAGTSHATTEPTWNKGIGLTTTDNTVTWTCRYIEATMLNATQSIVTVKGWNVPASSGIMIQHSQTAGTERITAMCTISSNVLTLTEDGVQVASFSLTNASYDTLSELVAAINAFKEPSDGTTSNWQAKLCDNTWGDGSVGSTGAGAAYNNYTTGGEQSRDLRNIAACDCTNSWQRLDMGLSGWYVVDRNVQKAHDDMVAQGLNPKAFAQSGGEFYPWMAHGHLQYEVWRGDPISRLSINPLQVPLARVRDWGGWVPHKDLNDAPNSPLLLTILKGYVDAAVDGGPWLLFLLCHWLQVDGTSGYNLNPQPPGSGWGSSESIFNAFLVHCETLINAGQLITCTPSELPRVAAMAGEPRSIVFNPKLRNGGVSIASNAGDAKSVAGWYIRTATTPTVSIDSNGVLNITAIGSQQLPLAQDLMLVPGQTYELTMYVEMDSAAVGNGVRVQIQTRRGPSLAGGRYRDMDPGASNVLVGPYLARSGLYRFRFTWPNRREYSKAYIRGLMTEPFDLSVNKNIVVNYANIGATADIDCSTGAALASAVTAKEVANRINTVVAGTAAYLTRAEYHTAARAVNGRVILESPFRANPGSTFWVKATAGSTASALAAIFGIGSGLICQGEPQMAGYQDVEDAVGFMVVDLNTTNGATLKIRPPTIQPAVYA